MEENFWRANADNSDCYDDASAKQMPIGSANGLQWQVWLH